MLCLIIAPALESVINIYETARKIADNSWIKIAMAYGDSAPGLQGRFHPEKCHILVATPERLINYVSQSTIKFESLKFFILDEVNRMIDMGFMANIEEIATHQTFKTENCNTMLFAVTFTEEIHRLASIILVKYDYSTIGYNNRKFSDVDQVFFIVDKFKKRRLLAALLTDYIGYSEDDCILVFVEEKKTADFLASFISETKIAATSIHGDRLNHERYEALRDFRSGRFKVLFATSGVSRHLVFHEITRIINYELPKDTEEYIRRVGLTGSVDIHRSATNFSDPNVDDIEQFFVDPNQMITLAHNGVMSYYIWARFSLNMPTPL